LLVCLVAPAKRQRSDLCGFPVKLPLVQSNHLNVEAIPFSAFPKVTTSELDSLLSDYPFNAERKSFGRTRPDRNQSTNFEADTRTTRPRATRVKCLWSQLYYFNMGNFRLKCYKIYIKKFPKEIQVAGGLPGPSPLFPYDNKELCSHKILNTL